MLDQLTDQKAMEFIVKVEEPFKSLPHLPSGIVSFLVQIAPWFALIGAILSLVFGPFIGVFGSIASLFLLSPLTMVWTVVTVVLSLANAVLLFMAYTPLKNREMKGWVLLFWVNMIGIVQGVVGLVGNTAGNFLSTLIGIVIGLYILFEMKSSYDGAIAGEVVKVIKKSK